MAKDDQQRGRPARPASGRPGSKNYEPARAATGSFRKTTRDRGYTKTKGFDYKGGVDKDKPFVAGANILDAQGKSTKRKSFSDYLKSTGNRADDPRNWEFHYKPSRPGFETRRVGKDGREVSRAPENKGRAMKAARQTGKEVYETQKIEYETQGIIQGTDQAGAIAKAKRGGRFGSTKVAANVAAQKQRGRRRAGGGAAVQGGGPFDAKAQTKTSRIA
jgi:hypothetical protein